MFKTNSISALTLILAVAFTTAANARNCSKGKPCGNSCISKNDVCHKSGGERAPAAAVDAPDPAEPAAVGKQKDCKKGKRCGDTCIPKKATCHAD